MTVAVAYIDVIIGSYLPIDISSDPVDCYVQ